MKKTLPSITIITVNHNGKPLLKRCFDSLESLDYPKDKIEIIMVDNCSSDGSIDLVRKKYPKIKIIESDTNNYCKANNMAIKKAKGDFVALINNDVKADKDWLIEAVSIIDNDSSVAGVGSKILFMDGKIQSAGHEEYPDFYWGDKGFKEKDRGQFDNITDIPSACGAAVLYRKKSIYEVGLFDEDFTMFLEDVDLGIRLHAKGWRILFCPKSIISHQFHATIGDESNARLWQEKNRLLLIAKHWPDKLAEALIGREYFVNNTDDIRRQEMFDAISFAYKKIIITHGDKTANKVYPELLFSLKKVFDYERNFFVQKIESLKEVQQLEQIYEGKRELLLRLKQEIRHKDEYLQQLTRQDKEKNELLTSLHKEIKNKDRQLEELYQQDKKNDKSLSEAEKRITRLEHEVTIKNDRLEVLGHKDGEKNEIISSLRQENKRKDQYLRELTKQDKDKNVLLADLHEKIRQKDKQIEEFSRREKTDKEAEKQDKQYDLIINSLQQESIAKNEKISNLWYEIGKKDEYNQKQAQEIQHLKETIDKKEVELWGIHNSNGFKYLLRPLWSVLWSAKKSLKQIFAFIKEKIPQGLAVKENKKFTKGYLRHIYKNFLPPTPKKLILMVTSRCNLNCQFCDIPEGDHGHKDLPKEQVFKIIDSIHSLGVEDLEITGGEPLLYKDLWEVVKYAVSYKIKVHIATNGLLVREQIDEIKNHQIETFCISIDGKEKTHDELRNLNGAYSRTIDAIKLLKENNKKVSVGFVVTNKNVYELEDIYNYFTSQDIYVTFWPVNHQPDLRFTNKDEARAFFEFVKKLKKRKKITRAQYRYYLNTPRYFKERLPKRRCLGLVRSFGINVTGDILPCCVWDSKDLDLGSVFTDDLEASWYSNKSYKLRKKIFTEGCLKCYNTCLSEFEHITGKSFIVPGIKEAFKKIISIKLGSKLQESIIRPEKPSAVLLNVTLKCNFSCLHCDNWKVKSHRELNFRQIKNTINNLSKWLGEGFELIIGGGEPLMRPDIIDTIKLCKAKKIRTTLTTNGFLLSKQLCDQIIDSGLTTLNFSIDGIKPKTHDFSRNKKGAFEKAMSALEYINVNKNNKLMLTISTILMEANLDEVLGLVDFAKEKKLTCINFLPLMQNFNSPADAFWYLKSDLWPKDFNKVSYVVDCLLQEMQKAWQQGLYQIIGNSSKQLTLFKDYYKDPTADVGGECTVGKRMFSITEDGHILLCSKSAPVGSIRTDKLDRLWCSSKAEKIRKNNRLCKNNCKILGCYNDEYLQTERL